MNDNKVFEGDDLDEAIKAASSSMGIPEDDIHYEMVEQGRKGLFGFGAQKVRIRVMPPLTDINPNELLGQPGPGQRGKRRRGSGAGAPAGRPPRGDGDARPAPRRGRGGGGGGGGGGGDAQPSDDRGNRRPRAERAADADAASGAPRRRRRRRGRGGKSAGEGGEGATQRSRPQPPPKPTGPPIDAEHAVPVEQTLLKMIETMGLSASAEIASLEGAVTLTLAGDDALLLRDRNKELLRAMQFLLNRMARRSWPEVPRVRLVCPSPNAGQPQPRRNDDGGERAEGGRPRRRRRSGRGGRGGGQREERRDDHVDDERDEEIMELGREVAQQVSQTGEEKLLEPMNAYERRLIHLAVREFDTVESTSDGDGSLKRVRIAPRD